MAAAQSQVSPPVIRGPLVRGIVPRLASSALAAAGWEVVLAPPVPSRCVVVFYPHTSNWDTVIGLGLKFMTGLSFHYAGKDTLFRTPLIGPLLVRWGGVPVNRRERTGFIEQMEAEFARRAEFRLAIAPEGTRGRTEHWKSGFYHLARAVGVPVALGFIDYPRREIGIGAYVDLTGDAAADMARIRAFYSEKRGRHPEHQSPVCLRDEAGGA